MDLSLVVGVCPFAELLAHILVELANHSPAGHILSVLDQNGLDEDEPELTDYRVLFRSGSSDARPGLDHSLHSKLRAVVARGFQIDVGEVELAFEYIFHGTNMRAVPGRAKAMTKRTALRLGRAKWCIRISPSLCCLLLLK